MQRIIILLTAVVIGMGLMGLATVQAETNEVVAVPRAMAQATVQMTMIQVQGETRTTARGIGTLMQVDNNLLLVTHDHWPQLQTPMGPDIVFFYDVNGKLLGELNGRSFFQHLLFKDSGTLLLRPPDFVLAQSLPVQMGDLVDLQVGDTVTVMRRQPSNDNQLVSLAMVVTAVDATIGIPILTLRSLDGSSIEPGDSGGGVWLNGRLVGNMWMTIRAESNNWLSGTVIKSTDQSQAAGLTTIVAELAQMSLQSYEMPSVSLETPS
ncbi:MAG: hypothetical protein AAF614_35155 [Chloroflexota bacterium]